MAKADLTIGERIARLNTTVSFIASETRLHEPLIMRVLDEERGGEPAPGNVKARLLETLSLWERTGVPVPERPRYEVIAEQQAQSMEAQIAARRESQRRYEEALARVDAERAAKVAAANQRVRDAAALRAENAIVLGRLREQSGLTLRAMSALTGATFSDLQRYEAGRPVGDDSGWDELIETYRFYARMGPKQAYAEAQRAGGTIIKRSPAESEGDE